MWNDSSRIVFSKIIKWGIKKISGMFNMKSIFMGSAIVFSGLAGIFSIYLLYVIRIKYYLSHRNKLTIKIKKYFFRSKISLRL